MIELLFLVALVAVGGLMMLGMLKLFFWFLLLPFKIGFWVFKGAIGLLLLFPLAVIGVCLVCTVLPFVAVVMAIPIAVLAGVIALARMIF